MTDKTTELTNLNPRLTEFQDTLYAKFAEENQTATKGQIVFVGSSLMETFPIEQWEAERDLDLPAHIYNRGVRATTTADLLAHMDLQIFDLAPSKVFINIGSNDLGFNVPEETFLANYKKIIADIQNRLPETQIYVMKYYPMNKENDFSRTDPDGKEAVKQLNHDRSNDKLGAANIKVEALANELGVNYIDVNAGLADENGNLKQELTFDGSHMLPVGFEIVLANMKQYL